ncbi:hypothetical protein ACK8P5_15860 [Paenibacillus sp. EC2-1]|uniref:hypothetical protein n=1 Tax=Paenibacillus sp. EC2-1 TaxID=3388665 RepID=UPI003BEEE70E
MSVSWIVTLLGVIVSLLGYFLIPNNWGYGILGFGLAHILLGVLEMFRGPGKSGAGN